jgi:cation diffusion facilitator CzcD-associated flavoprotein CzcO
MKVCGLDALEGRLKQDLEWLNFAAKDWVPRRDSNGMRVRDVVVIGAGMCGLVASLALRKNGVYNHVVYDAAPEGQEGPWVTIARMETLRSPKQLSGPAFGLPSLTFRAWYEAQHGLDAWERLFRIDRGDWMDYLVWYRRVLDLPVVNEARMVDLKAGPEGLLNVVIEHNGEAISVLTRKLVLATGRDGLGGNYVPDNIRDIDKRFWAHSAEVIDFDALAGKNVAVIGAGASAMDNAATALEKGAARVDMFIRRPTIPSVNKFMGIGSPGMVHGFEGLSPEWKWKLQDYANKSQTPPPRNSTQRVSRHANAYFHVGSPLLSIINTGTSLRVKTPKGTYAVDFMILATGFCVDFQQRPELKSIAQHIKLWKDGLADPALADDSLAHSPDLGPNFEFKEKIEGECPMLGNIYSFNFPANLSHGKLSGDIPAVSEGADRLARGIVRSLFVEDIEQHYDALLSYNDPELLGDEWTDADMDEKNTA